MDRLKAEPPSVCGRERRFSRQSINRIWACLALCFLVACSTAPKQVLVAKSSDANAPKKSERYQTKVQSVPSVVVSLIRQAQTLTAAQDYEKALQLLERAQRIAPSYSGTYLNLGYVYSAQGKAEAARQMFHRAESLSVNEKERREARKALSNERVLWP